MIYTAAESSHLEGTMDGSKAGPAYQPDDLFLVHTADGTLHAFLAYAGADGVYWREVGVEQARAA